VLGNGATGVDRRGRRFINSHTGRLLLDLRQRGYEVIYVEWCSTFERDANLREFCLDDHGLVSQLVSPKASWRLLPSLLSVCLTIVRADFVYLFFPGRLARLVAPWCWLLRRPYGVYIRGVQFSPGGRDARLLRRARFILTVSPTIERAVTAQCVDVATIRPMLDVSASDAIDRPPLAHAPDEWRLLFVGRLEAAKGVPELVDAVRQLRSEGMRCSLRLVGGGMLFKSLSADIRTDVQVGITCVGLVSDRDALMAEYAKAHILILPTHHEGFPRVLYEAMIKGLPIVTTMVGGIPGRLTHMENCYAVPVGDPQGIIEAIRTLTADLPLLNHLGMRGQATAIKVLATTVPHSDLIAERLR